MQLTRISENVYEIPKSGSMIVPGRLFASPALLEKIEKDKTLEQLRNMACLQGIQKYAMAMPDAHQGYGFCIGGVTAFDVDKGIISPGGVGYDINCGVRLLKTPFTVDDLIKHKHELLKALLKEIPAGVGKAGITALKKDVLVEILHKGAEWAIENGYGTKDDLKKTEEYGKMKGADHASVSERALARGKSQIGSLGSGNHFLELQMVDNLFDKKTAERFGFTKRGQVAVMIHCGSRGFGHQVASDYIKKMEDKHGTAHLPDRELVNAPIKSPLGEQYVKAMACAMNFAFVNRQMITHWVREVFKKVIGDGEITPVYDVCHNIAKFETHDGKEVCVHRKGATRSFGPGLKDIPEVYRDIGQPVIIPGSMGTASHLMLGTKKASDLSFGSAPHGAGRATSRAYAIQHWKADDIKKELADRNIEVMATTWRGISEEAPQAYKDVDEVIDVAHAVGMATKVIRFVPLGVIKG